MRTVLLLAALACVVSAGEPAIGYGRGDVHPDFELPKLGGGKGRLSDFRGKRLLLFNFASW